MADRRMFSKVIVNSARFLRMPSSARLLYYDLGMSADDDGVVEAFTVMRTTGAVEDDLRILVARGFIRVLNEDMVSHIVDWKQNNQIRKDRYCPSAYAYLLADQRSCLPDDDGVTTTCQPDDNQMTTTCQPDDNQTVVTLATQYRLGKVRLGEESECEVASPPAKPSRTRFEPPTGDMVREYMQHYAEQKGMTVNAADQAERFVDHFAANGWKVSGKTPMQDWQASARNWLRNDKTLHAQSPAQPRVQHAQATQQPLRFATGNEYR